MDIVYFSGKTGNTESFVEKLNINNQIFKINNNLIIDKPFILISPTYANGDGSKNTPKQVIEFLNKEVNRNFLKGVIGSGNINFGRLYCLSSHIISHKCKVPILYKFELRGNENDRKNIERIIDELSLT